VRQIDQDRAVDQRAIAIFQEMRARILKHTDRMFAGLMLVQWLAGIVAALVISPRTWAGAYSSTHIHVWAALFLGGAIAFLPVVMALVYPGETITRHVIAIGQMLTSALLIHLTGGRIETHFHVFGSLAFLSFYRDWRVLVSASLVVAIDHLVRGIVWPQSVYGVLAVQPWRWLEHTGWVVFEDVFLTISIVQSLKEMMAMAHHQASLETVNAKIESEVRERTSELQASETRALAASRAKSEFLSSMSHEIRTPMNAILGMADLLAETRLTADQQRFVQTMISNGDALLDLINGILDLARIESGRLDLEQTELDLEELVEHVAETLGMRAHEKGLELTTRILPDVPRRLVGDSLRLRQVLINLVGNAIKFTEQGEVALTVESEAGLEGGVQLHFSVRDTGIGIAPDKLEAVFHFFTQADSSTTRKYGGSGLGLTIASRLVQLMGGRLWATSEVGKGSVFHFVACPGVAPVQALEVEELPRLEGERVLVVDDNATNRMILRETLLSQGAETAEASCGAEALSEAVRARTQGRPYRLVLLDCGMPGMDDFQLAAKLRNHAGGSPAMILMLSSEDANQTLASARKLGIDACVVKPVKRAELLHTIARVLGSSASARGKVDQRPSWAEHPPRAGARRLKILLVEDSPDNRQLIEAYLRNLPYELDVSENGQVAVAKFVKGRYDLVLMDMQMPVMDGYTAVRKIRQWEREQGRAATPIAALTASALEEDVRNAIAAGCTTHLSKPIKKSHLLPAIVDLVNAPAASATNGDSKMPMVDGDPSFALSPDSKTTT
jgi:two-component system, sensor histidine kinase and response regulator